MGNATSIDEAKCLVPMKMLKAVSYRGLGAIIKVSTDPIEIVMVDGMDGNLDITGRRVENVRKMWDWSGDGGVHNGIEKCIEFGVDSSVGG
jgi:hypothetical protein